QPLNRSTMPGYPGAGNRAMAPEVTLGGRLPGPSLASPASFLPRALGVCQENHAPHGSRCSDPATLDCPPRRARGRGWRACRAVLAMLAVLPANVGLAGPRVDVVVGADAPELERFAAQELAGQFQRLFEADVKIGSNVPEEAGHLVYV